MSDQVVLAHSHRVLRGILAGLAAAGVATVALPDLRTQSPVRDLVAVAALATSGDERAFARVARLREYGLSAREAEACRDWARDRDARGSRTSSPRVAAALARLGRDLDGLDQGVPAADVMKAWLLDRSGYLRRVLLDPDGPRRARTVASLHHLIRIAEEHEAQGDRDHSRLLARIDHAGGLRQATAFGRATTPDGGDTLSVMTIHAARGRSFRVVHLAGVRNGGFGLEPRPPTLQPPSALAAAWDGADDAAEIEAALFRVAVSRATECLHVSGSPRRT
ncbi:MAG: hypothetical protein INR67_19800 [Jatrophihabitans endophyticus]|nr:hypothetical protein [Jatrophihabitans endophyticus]